MARTQQPPLNYQTKGAAAFKGVCFDPANSLWKFSGAGAPTDGAAGDGAGWAGPGSEYTDATNAFLYINTGTKASPTWTKVGTQS